MASLDAQHAEASLRIRDAEVVVALTGAGISAESHIPTFRGKDGTWNNVRVDELATPEGFHADPTMVWEWYSERRRMCLECEPNRGHAALAQLEADHSGQVTVVTQNVDGLHRRAGSEDVIEVHGQLFLTKCTHCPHEMPNDQQAYAAAPLCPHCNSLLRPGVVWFGEMMPEEEMARATGLATQCDVMLVVGTSAVVYPIASLPGVAKSHGACVIEVNPDPTPITDRCDFAFPSPAGEALPRLVAGAV